MDHTTPTTTTTTTTARSGGKMTRFSLFNALPHEIRQHIWTLALLAPLTPSLNNPPGTARPLHIRPYRTLEPGDPRIPPP